jgi:hypothetical protein
MLTRPGSRPCRRLTDISVFDRELLQNEEQVVDVERLQLLEVADVPALHGARDLAVLGPGIHQFFSVGEETLVKLLSLIGQYFEFVDGTLI